MAPPDAQLPLPELPDLDRQAQAALLAENERLRQALLAIAYSGRTKTGIKEFAREALAAAPVITPSLT